MWRAFRDPFVSTRDAMLQFRSLVSRDSPSIELGGQLPEGTYQFLLAYADPETKYHSTTP
jgi:hypothetical protein